ncbi:Crinkler (CRN) family protein [Thraustotheca clavata]|uniref:Crinkler (CRN) family protein n=1 Tax=Thraustotheca clavata TaxID=74557 RepID=A0A1W0A7C4_9STRA|nr:Crinkler (CRN) family protein [Thraustotheca clavata]
MSILPGWRLLDKEVFGANSVPKERVVHVVVGLPEVKQPSYSVSESIQPMVLSLELRESSKSFLAELKYYKERGELIRMNCPSSHTRILGKINTIYAENKYPLPFICVEGSSGMGKSQLAFTLQGDRPYYYILANVDASQPMTTFYLTAELWTYGFIYALLKYSNTDEHQTDPKMIRFDELERFNIQQRSSRTVQDLVNEMKENHRKLPFFILDELCPNTDGPKGRNLPAFQRNVFRICDLVVIVMGTNSKIANLISQSHGSYDEPHIWMSLVPRFPKYQLQVNEEEKEGWSIATAKYPFLVKIVQNSRGRFTRHFIENVAKSCVNGPKKLCDLMDEAIAHVYKKTHDGKAFLSSETGKKAQSLAISYYNAEPAYVSLKTTEVDEDSPEEKKTEMLSANSPVDEELPPPPKRFKCEPLHKDVGEKCMHHHFANLVDKGLTDFVLAKQFLKLVNDGTIWEPKFCFPSIEDDILLYLAILGGKECPTYCDYFENIPFSAKYIHKEFPTNQNTNAIKNDSGLYVNMVAHAIFSSSRRNGVQGIPFDDFLSCLLGEFEDRTWKRIDLTWKNEPFVFSNLIPILATKTIPFLAPVNTFWPKYIFEQNHPNGCYYGNFYRAADDDRCDIYIKHPQEENQEHRHIMKPEERLKCYPIFLSECKYWENSLKMHELNTIVDRVDYAWAFKEKQINERSAKHVKIRRWSVLIVFCLKLEQKKELNRQATCCVIDREGKVTVINAKEGQNEHVIVVETWYGYI